MPSFDIASEVDVQTLDNAINTVKKEISNRFDFKGSPVEITLDKKQYIVTVEVESDMKMKQVIDVIIKVLLQKHLTFPKMPIRVAKSCAKKLKSKMD